MQSLLRSFNSGDITLREIANLTYDLHIINLKSPKIYAIIVDYFLKHGFTDVQIWDLGYRIGVNFVHSLMYNHSELTNEEFFIVIRRFMLSNMDKFNKFQLIKLLDIYKYNATFMNEPQSRRLKSLLEAQLEAR
jgi:hypothetical protein